MLRILNIARISRAVPIVAIAVVLALAAACSRVPLLAPTGSTITLTALASTLPSNGTTKLIAQVLEPSGQPPHSGTHVIFTTTLGTIEPSETETDVNGQALATFRAGNTSGTATITATSGGANVGTNGAVKIAIGTAAISSVFVSATPNTLPAAGGQSTISALVRDTGGNPLPGVSINFSTTAGTLTSTIATADANGVATTTLNTNRTATVTATAGSVTTPPSSGGGTGTTTNVTNQVTVNVNVGPSIAFGAQTSPQNPVAGQLVSFTINITQAANNAGTPLRTLSVDFGDGQRLDMTPGNATTVTASHVYRAPGVYTVTAVATDLNGDTGSAQTAVAVGSSQPTVGITADNDTVKVGTAVKFTINASIPGGSNTSGVAIQNVHIDFGDGRSADLGAITSSTQVSHTYNSPNTYTVTATAVTMNGGTASGQTTINVTP